MDRPGFSPLRVGAALALILCWVIATNHCGLAMTLRGSAGGFGHCGHCAPEKAPCQNGALPCCQSLKASLPGVARAPSLADKGQEALPSLENASASVVAAGGTEARLKSREHAPPLAAFFIEVVLRSALPAHGPPRIGA